MNFSNGVKLNYSLFYNYENFVNKLYACKYFFDRSPNSEWVPVAGKENLQVGLDFSHNFKNNNYLNSYSGKYVLNHNSLKIHKNVGLKGYGDLFDSLNVSWRFVVY
jgi:hypothetical protein